MCRYIGEEQNMIFKPPLFTLSICLAICTEFENRQEIIGIIVIKSLNKDDNQPNNLLSNICHRICPLDQSSCDISSSCDP